MNNFFSSHYNKHLCQTSLTWLRICTKAPKKLCLLSCIEEEKVTHFPFLVNRSNIIFYILAVE